MLIAQITDIHIGFDRDHPDEPNLRRFCKVLDRLKHGPNRPDLLLLTGDLTEHGDAASYRILAEALADCPFPVWPIVGNHDDRATFGAAFQQVRPDGGFFQYGIEGTNPRIVMLDTLEPGRHGGAFCEARVQWLRAQLEAHPDTPTIIVMHHPPIVSGIDWMDSSAAEPWFARFAEAIKGHGQIQAILCGHLHRPIMTGWPVLTGWQRVPLIVCPSSAPAVALNLTLVDPEKPDGRVLITDEAPAYGLHYWNGQGLVSHFESLGKLDPLASFDAALQPMIRAAFAERG